MLRIIHFAVVLDEKEENNLEKEKQPHPSGFPDICQQKFEKWAYLFINTASLLMFMLLILHLDLYTLILCLLSIVITTGMLICSRFIPFPKEDLLHSRIIFFGACIFLYIEAVAVLALLFNR